MDQTQLQMEVVDVLSPIDYEPTGEVKALVEAWESGNWIGTFNLWIVTMKPSQSIIFQQRSLRSSWAPGLLDVAVGGHYHAGERGTDGLREAREELGRAYLPEDITYLGRRLNVMVDREGRTRRNVVSVFIVRDDDPLTAYIPERRELEALYACPIVELERLYREPTHSFVANGRVSSGMAVASRVRRGSFPDNWNDYHPRMVRLARAFLAGEKQLSYG